MPHPHGPQGARRDLPRPKRQTHSEPDRTLGVPLLRGDSCALHPRTRPHDSESHRRAPAPAPTPGKAVCLVLSLKMHPNQALGAEWRLECLDTAGCGTLEPGLKLARLTLPHELGKVLRQRDRLGDFTLLILEPSEFFLFVIVE